MGQMLLPTDRPPIAMAPCNNPVMVTVPANSTMATTVTPDAHYAKIEDPGSCLVNDKTRENERHGVVDRGATEFQTIPDNMLTTINVKKNVKGVKLVGMEGGTLRRPSLQVSESNVTSL